MMDYTKGREELPVTLKLSELPTDLSPEDEARLLRDVRLEDAGKIVRSIKRNFEKIVSPEAGSRLIPW